jgi:hypothetical protein
VAAVPTVADFQDFAQAVDAPVFGSDQVLVDTTGAVPSASSEETTIDDSPGVGERLRQLSSVVQSAIGAVRERISALSLRRLAYVAAAAILVVGGWLSQPYWPTLTNPASEPDRATEKPSPAAAAPAPARKTGSLMARSDPPGARVIVDGTPRGVTPLTLDDLSLGRHSVVIETDEGSVRRTVTVSADRTAMVNESVFAGFLKVFAPFDLRISDGTRAIRLDDQNQVLLPPGPYELQLSNAELGYRETRRVDVIPGQTTTVSIVPPPSAVTVVANAPSVVLIDGEQVGETPLVAHPIRLGTRDIVVRSSGGAERRYTRRVTVAPLQIEVDFSRP